MTEDKPVWTSMGVSGEAMLELRELLVNNGVPYPHFVSDLSIVRHTDSDESNLCVEVGYPMFHFSLEMEEELALMEWIDKHNNAKETEDE
jgi:hypothetical protein